MLTLGRSLDVRGLALVHPGRADGWWALRDRRWAWHDGERLFVEIDDHTIRSVPLDGPVHLVPTEDGCLAWNDRVQVRFGAEVEVVTARNLRLGGRAARRAPGGPWRVEGVELPMGARRARDLRPLPSGRGALWTGDGWLYRLTDAVEAIGRAGAWVPGPLGAVLVGDDDGFTRGAAPGHRGVALPCPLVEPVRFSFDGRRVAGLDPDGEGVLIDLVTARVLERRDAIPVGEGWLRPDGVIEARGVPVRRGIREASWALRGDRLAGPGGMVWDLRTGRPLGGEVHLGATVATGRGFSSVHWETGRGVHLDPDGRVVGVFGLHLDDDDVVVDGVTDGDGARFGTAMGAGFRVDGRVVAAEPPDVARPDPPEGWELPVEAEADVDGRRWGWTTEGLLLARIP